MSGENSFALAIQDIFSVPDFMEPLTISGSTSSISVCSYVGTDKPTYTEFGYDHGEAIDVTCKCTDWTDLERGQQVTFRGQSWKVAEWDTDSHALTYRVTLKSLTSK